MKKIMITMGLPASGKTMWARTIKATYFDVDNFTRQYKGFDIGKGLRYFDSRYDSAIVDGLFLNTNSIIQLLDSIHKYCRVKTCVFEIHFWKENREQCLINDRGRRDTNSETTIKNAVLEYPDLDKIKEKFPDINLSVVEHDVYVKKDWEIFADKNNLITTGDEYLRSSNWCLGGSWGNYLGETGEVGAEPAENFTALDNLLEKLCPTITFLQYKKLLSLCVKTETDYEPDYYGGGTEKAWYQCHLPTLYKFLVDNGYLESEHSEGTI